MDFYPETPLVNINDFELHDFIEDPNFDQFINLIRGKNEDDAIINGNFVNNPLFHSCPPNPFGQYNDISENTFDPTSLFSSFPCFVGEAKVEANDGGDNYASPPPITTTTTINANTNNNTKPRTKPDRSKTLISEQRRRGRMKEKLYALRSLVPNITKMDKASIIEDAVSYMYDLQSQAKKLTAEIAGLEASLLVSKNDQGSNESPQKIQFSDNTGSVGKKIIQMEMFQVDEKGFYVKIVCNKGERVAVSLFKSLESLKGLDVQNSNLATLSDNFLLTFSLNVKGSVSEQEINLSNVKLWVIGAFINQGFEFLFSSHAS